MHFLGGCDRSIATMQEVKAGDFTIKGRTVTLTPAFSDHHEKKAAIIEQVDVQINAEIMEAKERASLKKIGLAPEVIEQMLAIKRMQNKK